MTAHDQGPTWTYDAGPADEAPTLELDARSAREVEDSLLEAAAPPPAVWRALERQLRREGLIR